MARSWKAAERVVAKRLGGTRVPITGRSRGSAPDVEHPDLGVEIKTRKALPGWMEEAMQQAEACANGRLPVAIVHEDYRGFGRSIVMIRLADFEGRFMVDGRLR